MLIYVNAISLKIHILENSLYIIIEVSKIFIFICIISCFVSIQQTFINDFANPNGFIGDLAFGNLTKNDQTIIISQFTGDNDSSLVQTWPLAKIIYPDSKFSLFYIMYS